MELRPTDRTTQNDIWSGVDTIKIISFVAYEYSWLHLNCGISYKINREKREPQKTGLFLQKW